MCLLLPVEQIALHLLSHLDTAGAQLLLQSIERALVAGVLQRLRAATSKHPSVQTRRHSPVARSSLLALRVSDGIRLHLVHHAQQRIALLTGDELEHHANTTNKSVRGEPRRRRHCCAVEPHISLLRILLLAQVRHVLHSDAKQHKVSGEAHRCPQC